MRFFWIGLVAAVFLGAWLLMQDGGRAAADVDHSVAADSASPAMNLRAPDTAEAATAVASAVSRTEIATPPQAERSGSPSTAPGQPLRVKVLNSAGAPVQGVPLNTSTSLNHRHFSPRAFVTEPDGTVELPAQMPGQDGSYWIQVQWIGPEPVALEVGASAQPAEPLVLTLPPYGAVRVEAAPELAAFNQAGVGIQDSDPLQPAWPMRTAATRDGAARFSFVALGQDLFATLGPVTGGSQLRRLIRGPEAAGQTVVARFEAGQDAILAGRVLSAKGEVLASQSLRLRLDCARMTYQSGLETDAEGRFRYPVPPPALEAEPHVLTFQIVREESQPFAGDDLDYSQAARAVLPEPLPNSELDLGDLRFAPEAVLAAGRVVDAAGAGIGGVWVHVRKRSFVDSQGNESFEPMPDGGRARTGQDGGFRIFGAVPPEPLRISANSAQHTRMDPVPFVPGDERIELRLLQAGGLEGSLIFPEGADGIGIKLTLTPAVGDPLRQEVDAREGRGTFKFRSLTPGLYDLALSLEDRQPAFHVVPQLLIGEGGPAADPRVKDLDLSPYLKLARLRMRTEDESPLPSQILVSLLAPDGHGGSGVAFSHKEGVSLVFLTQASPSDFVVHADGYLLEYLPAVDGDREVVLRRGVTVKLRVAGSAPLANALGACKLRAEVQVPPGMPDVVLAFGNINSYAEPDAQRMATFPLNRLGRLEVTWLVPTQFEHDGKLHPSNQRQPCILLEIGPGDDGRVFEIPPPVLD